MKINFNSISLNVNTYGSEKNTPLIFLHAFPLKSKMWDSQVEVFKNDFYVITYDTRGLGDSEVGDGQYTMEQFADDLIAIMDHLNIPKAVWCGLSMGGYCILRAYEKHKDRCRGLILSSTRSAADDDAGKINRANAIKEVQNNGLEGFTETFLKKLFNEEEVSQNPTSIQNTRSWMLANNPVGVCGNLIAIGMRTDTTENLKNITVPTCIIVGENDVLTPVKFSQEMHEQIPESKLHVIPGINHMSNLQKPEEFNRIIKEFLSNQ